MSKASKDQRRHVSSLHTRNTLNLDLQCLHMYMHMCMHLLVGAAALSVTADETVKLLPHVVVLLSRIASVRQLVAHHLDDLVRRHRVVHHSRAAHAQHSFSHRPSPHRRRTVTPPQPLCRRGCRSTPPRPERRPAPATPEGREGRGRGRRKEESKGRRKASLFFLVEVDGIQNQWAACFVLRWAHEPWPSPRETLRVLNSLFRDHGRLLPTSHLSTALKKGV